MRGDFFGRGSELAETVIKINRTAAVIKGGRRFSFSAIVVVGDHKGSVGFGYGKANEVQPAVEKAAKNARRSLHKLVLKGTTIPHEVWGKFSKAKVLLKPAGPGTGVIAGRTVRAVCEVAGIRNILSKSFGANNPLNLVKATMDGLLKLKDRRAVEKLRGVVLPERGAGEENGKK